jgi:hypothetical protein
MQPMYVELVLDLDHNVQLNIFFVDFFGLDLLRLGISFFGLDLLRFGHVRFKTKTNVGMLDDWTSD